MDKAERILREACKFYCDWYDRGEPPGDRFVGASLVAYELVSFCREALAEIEKEKVSYHGTDDDKRIRVVSRGPGTAEMP